jgi:ABC-type branched-subunit amino acid transport system ATPase component
MTPEIIKEKIVAIAQKRSALIQLSTQENLGNLTIDVIQALEEINDLLAEFTKTFPDCPII